MERSQEDIKQFTLEVIKKDPYYNDGSDVQELYNAIEDGFNLTSKQKELLNEVLTESAKTATEETLNSNNILSSIDELSIYADAWGQYIIRG